MAEIFHLYGYKQTLFKTVVNKTKTRKIVA